MTTDATNPDTGVADQAAQAQTDDIDTEAFDRMEAPEPEDDEAEPTDPESGEGEGDEAEGEDKAESDDKAQEDVEDVEYEGKSYKVPKELKDALLRQRDYTAKTTELAEQRRAFEAEQQTWKSQREESMAALPEEHAKVAVISNNMQGVQARIAELEKIDWPTWRAQVINLPDDDPNKAQYRQYRTAYDAARETLADYERELATAKNDLSTKEQQRLASQQEALAKARQETSAALIAEGWDQDRVTKVAEFGIKELGLTAEELRDATDPRTWKSLDRLVKAEEEVKRLTAALKQHETANRNSKAQEVTPAAKAKGSGASARDPASPRGDGLSTEEWMRRRNAQRQRA